MRFTVVANHHTNRKQWPWAVVDGTSDELCAFATDQATAQTTADMLNRNINALGSLPEVKRTLKENEL